MMLNKRLYERLLRIFGNVKIHNDGETFGYSIINGKVSIQHWGETYSVNCPYCKDKRSRLWIPHIWGTIVHGEKIFFAKCFNEDCISNKDNLKDLIRQVSNRSLPIQYKYSAIQENPHVIQEVKLLGSFIPIVNLSDYHPAVTYLISRNFDHKKLYEQFNIHVANPLDSEWGGRIIIPIYYKGKCVGWQGRSYIDQEPKYKNVKGLRLHNYLYNFDRAITIDKKELLVMEGVTDVWRMQTDYGIPAVALFGKTLSKLQHKLLCNIVRTKTIIIALDGDAANDASAISKRIPTSKVIRLRTGEQPDTNPEKIIQCIQGIIRPNRAYAEET